MEVNREGRLSELSHLANDIADFGYILQEKLKEGSHVTAKRVIEDIGFLINVIAQEFDEICEEAKKR